MNVLRRKQIAAIIEALSGLSAQVESLKEDIDAVMGDEQEYFDAMPESLQGGEKGQRAEEVIYQLQAAYDDLDGQTLDTVIGYLEEAAA